MMPLVSQHWIVRLKGGYRNFFHSFIGPVGHNIWWENSRNRSFGPKKGSKNAKVAHFQASKSGIFSSG